MIGYFPNPFHLLCVTGIDDGILTAEVESLQGFFQQQFRQTRC
jgi:hypothetical protein